MKRDSRSAFGIVIPRYSRHPRVSGPPAHAGLTYRDLAIEKDDYLQLQVSRYF